MARTFKNAARALGRERGGNAAEWWGQDAIGGRASGGPSAARATADKVLCMFNLGDPSFYDSIPRADLSGEWADGMTPARLADEIGMAGWLDAGDARESGADRAQYLDELCDEYCASFDSACVAAVVRACKRAAR